MIFCQSSFEIAPVSELLAKMHFYYSIIKGSFDGPSQPVSYNVLGYRRRLEVALKNFSALSGIRNGSNSGAK